MNERDLATQPNLALAETIVDQGIIQIGLARQLAQDETQLWQFTGTEYGKNCDGPLFMMNRIASPTWSLVVERLTEQGYKLAIRQVNEQYCSYCDQLPYGHHCFPDTWGKSITYALYAKDLLTDDQGPEGHKIKDQRKQAIKELTNLQLSDIVRAQADIKMKLADNGGRSEAPVWQFDQRAIDSSLSGSFRIDRITDERTKVIATRLKDHGFKVTLQLITTEFCSHCELNVGHNHCGPGNTLSYSTNRTLALYVSK